MSAMNYVMGVIRDYESCCSWHKEAISHRLLMNNKYICPDLSSRFVVVPICPSRFVRFVWVLTIKEALSPLNLD